MRVHLVGVSRHGHGRARGALREAGHEVSGSDVAFDPPIGPALAARWASRCLQGYDAAHLEPAAGPRRRRQRDPARQPRGAGGRALGLRADVDVGARCASTSSRSGGRSSSPARTARRRRARCARGSSSRAGFEPGWFIGGVPKGLPAGAAIGSTRVRPGPRAARRSSSRATSTTRSTGTSSRSSSTTSASAPDDVAIVTSVEHDHIDIYPDVASYEAAFRALRRARARRAASSCATRATRARARSSREEARARVAWYALERRRHGRRDADVARRRPRRRSPTGRRRSISSRAASSCGRFALRVPGRAQRAQRGRGDRGVRRGLRRRA